MEFSSSFKRLNLNVVLILITVFCAVGLTGCKSLAEGDQRSELVATVAIQVATSKVINRSGDPSAKAQRIVDIARTAKGLVDGGSLSLVADLHDEIYERIDWAALDPGDTLLAQALITGVRAELELRIDDDLLSEQASIVLQLVLDNIIDAASVYITPD